MCLCSLSSADSSPTTYWLVSLNAFCQPERERAREGEREREREKMVDRKSTRLNSSQRMERWDRMRENKRNTEMEWHRKVMEKNRRVKKEMKRYKAECGGEWKCMNRWAACPQIFHALNKRDNLTRETYNNKIRIMTNLLLSLFL